jgi:hypothetical protein
VIDEDAIGERFRALAGEFDERRRRLWAAADARSAGYGGIAAVARATGISEGTIRRGLDELESGERVGPGRVRRAGGGRRPLTETDPTLLDDLERLLKADTRGDPESPLRWTAKSVRELADALGELGHRVHFASVAKFLRLLAYSLQANRKAKEGSQHPDRDAQFEHIAATVKATLNADQPVTSVDTKKKELVGDFKNAGREWRPKGSPELVRTHDFKDKELGKAILYGIYDLADDTGWVSVGIDHDTAQFAVASIQSWWRHLGAERYPEASTLTITADCGGSKGNRTREDRAAAPGRPDRPTHPGIPLPARHQQVEQNRAPPVQLHQPQLARQTPHLARGHHQPDRRDHHPYRPEGIRPTRRPHLPRQSQGTRRRTRRRPAHRRHLPPRMELHHQTQR